MMGVGEKKKNHGFVCLFVCFLCFIDFFFLKGASLQTANCLLLGRLLDNLIGGVQIRSRNTHVYKHVYYTLTI